MVPLPKMTLAGRNAFADFASNKLVLLLTLFGLTFLVACGGSGSSPTPPDPPSFGTGTLNGTYVFRRPH
jgi:hypothetical protein